MKIPAIYRGTLGIVNVGRQYIKFVYGKNETIEFAKITKIDTDTVKIIGGPRLIATGRRDEAISEALKKLPIKIINEFSILIETNISVKTIDEAEEVARDLQKFLDQKKITNTVKVTNEISY